MNGVFERLVAAFVTPVDEEGARLADAEWQAPAPAAPSPRSAPPARPAPPAGPAPSSPPAIAVLARPGEAVAAGAAVALGLAKGPVVLAVWGREPGRAVRVPAWPAARRLASRLAERGHAAAATGRLVVVTLAEGIDEALRVAAATDVAAVLAVAGPRDDTVDRVLREHDRVLVAGDGVLADLAAASVAALGVRAEPISLPDAAVGRILATTGAALVAPWRAPVQAALR